MFSHINLLFVQVFKFSVAITELVQVASNLKPTLTLVVRYGSQPLHSAFPPPSQTSSLTPQTDSRKSLLQHNKAKKAQNPLLKRGHSIFHSVPFVTRLVVGKVVNSARVHSHLVWNQSCLFIQPHDFCNAHISSICRVARSTTKEPSTDTIVWGWIGVWRRGSQCTCLWRRVLMSGGGPEKVWI